MDSLDQFLINMDRLEKRSIVEGKFKELKQSLSFRAKNNQILELSKILLSFSECSDTSYMTAKEVVRAKNICRHLMDIFDEAKRLNDDHKRVRGEPVDE